jgi:alpha-galactosidase
MRSSLLLMVFAAVCTTPVAAASPGLTAGDASISQDRRAGTWTLSAGGTSLVLALDPSRDFHVLRLATASDQPLTVDTVSDTTVTVNGTPIVFGSRAAGFVYQDVTTRTIADATALQLDAVFDLPAAGLRITRHYGIASGSPTFETWNTYETSRPSVALSNLTPFRALVAPGTLHWLTGLQGENADAAAGGAFTLQEKRLAAGERFFLGADGRSSESAVPMLAIDGPADEFYVALMWSGAWKLEVGRETTGLSVDLGLGPMTTTVVNGQPLDGPHVLFGAVRGGFVNASAALRSYVLPGIRDGRPLVPLVTYNTWYAHGARIDETSVRGEMLRAAALGVELFVVDAGWYAGAGSTGAFDFDTGLGTWEADPGRFPSGLKPLADYSHSLGMKFGIWVEPERVELAQIENVGIEEPWLAQREGTYGSARTAQICFASEEARFVLAQLVRFIERIEPDYVKWDNNFWINCDRPGHDHGSTDGNFGHVRGLYEVLATLRARFPNLLIENVSGGGNRLDLGMLQFSDVAWMSDRTAPSLHVRHNLQGLSAVFPPAYLLSFVIDHPDEPLRHAADLSLYFRSRMQGAFGLSFRNEAFSDTDLKAMAAEIEIYKGIRGTLSLASASLLSLQATRVDGPPWDLLQETVTGAEQLLLNVVRSDIGLDRVIVKPIGLQPTTTYDVRSVDAGPLGSASGADLMQNGIEVMNASVSAAHVLIVTARP